MITKKELQYVNSWPSKIPMPGYDYSKIVMDELMECYDIYTRNYQDKEYNLTFSNGEEIDFNILSANLCHMLGIDYQNIKGDYFYDYRQEVLGITSQNFSSFQLLEAILENSEKVIERDNDINCNAKIINYYKSLIKCNIFKKFSDFESFNFAAVNITGEDKKMLFVPSSEAVCPYFGMDICPSDYEKFVVRSLIAFDDPKSFFENKEVVIPTQIIISDNNNLKKVNATASEKIQLLTMYKNLINMYSIPNMINITSDYENMLNESVIKK